MCQLQRSRRAPFASTILGCALLTLAGCSDNDNGDSMQTPDTTAPAVSLSPTPAVASRVVTLDATASDDVGVARVEFFVDGASIGVDTSAPFSFAWDTATVAEGMHTLTATATDGAGNSATSAEVTVEVNNEREFTVTLAPSAEVPAVVSEGSGTATLMINVGTGAVGGTLDVAGFTPTAAHIHEGHAGQNGAVLVGLDQDPDDAAHFDAPASATLTIAQVDRLLEGGLYVNAHSARHPGGEVRGQILPAGFEVVSTPLEGRQEVPAVATPAAGTGAITIDRPGGRAWVHLTLAGLEVATAAHVHRAFAGLNGDIEIPLVQDSGAAAHWFADGVDFDGELIAALDGGELYVNAHSQAHPGGEVRGQLIPPGIELVAGLLEGRQEIPRHESAASGSFALTLERATGEYLLHANATGADDATAAHIHDGYAGVNGDVVVPLEQDAEDGGHWSASGSFDAALTEALDAGRLYVNIHTPARPGGEIRGQIAPQTVIVSFDAVDGEQETPPVATTAVGLAATTLDTRTDTFTVHVRADGIDDATAAHVHRGYAGEPGPVAIPLTQDPEDPGHWLVTTASLTSEQRADFDAGRHYVNLHTAEHMAGEIRGQIVPPAIEVLFTALTGGEVVPPVTTVAGGRVVTTVDRALGTIVVQLDTTDLPDATSAAIAGAPAGANGADVAALTQDTTIPAHWSLATFALDAGQFDDYGAGELYAIVRSTTHPDGAIRGQIVPPSAPPPDTTAPTVTVGAPAGELSGTVTVTATATDDNGISEVRFFADGASIGTDATAPYAIDWDTTTVADGTVTLTAEASDPAGNVGTSAGLDVSVVNAVPTVTFAQIQAEVFTPRCSGCHSGPTSGTLPSGMNLSNASASYAALVDVDSLQVPSLKRVDPGSPDSSYLIDKLAGTQTVGDRMPQGGPFLSPEQIDEIRAWIAAGAPGP